MRDDPSVVPLVVRARDGDQRAWDQIVERYAPLVWAICRRRYRLGEHDAADVGQTVWLRLVEQLGALREPAALPRWLATTTRRECLRVLQAARDRQRLEDPASVAMADGAAALVDQALLAAERDLALHQALAWLPQRCQRLLSLLMEDPPAPYAEVSARLRVPVGGIGPNRARCLERPRRSPALAALVGAQARQHDPLPTSNPRSA